MKLYGSIACVVLLFLTGCAVQTDGYFTPETSYLNNQATDNIQNSPAESDITTDVSENDTKVNQAFSWAPKMALGNTNQTVGNDPTNTLSDTEMVSLSADKLKLGDFLNYVLGQLLNLNYILVDSEKMSQEIVTLNLSTSLSKKRLYVLVEELLSEKGYTIKFNDGVYYVNNENANGNGLNTAFGYGSSESDVPAVSSDVIQLVPFEFGVKPGVNTLVGQVANVSATPDFAQNVMIVKGKRKEVLKAISLINLIDNPIFRDREVALFKSSYVSVEDLMNELPTLLINDGFTVGNGAETTRSISIVPIERQSILIMFANGKLVIDRAHFWLKQLDVPSSGDEKQYFIYQPMYARAIDLSKSLIPLLGGNESPSTQKQQPSAITNNGLNESESSNRNNNEASSKNHSTSFSSEELTVVVDEQSNALIINSTGQKYRALLPLLKRLDLLPKQIILEVMIAEVTLKDEFKQGVEFALSKGLNAASKGSSLSLSAVGGLTYSLSGLDGDFTANFFNNNELSNVLSRPSLVVRDGVTASIVVGTSIPVVGSVTNNATTGSTRSVQYRKTGVDLSVTPTVNSQGVVIMEIIQQISNQVEGGTSVEGAPSIFERSIQTEVVAESGQTVILGGLISENNTKSSSGVPGLKDIPLLGVLFSSKSDVKDKTELVVLVTPRIIESSEQWLEIKKEFEKKLSQISLKENREKAN